MTDLLAHESIDENLRFLTLEVRKQLERTQEYIERRTPRLLDLVLARDDYIDNLKTLIQRKVVSLAARIAEENKANLYLIKAIDVTTLNLERIADFCVNVVNQVDYIENEKILERVNFEPFFAEVISGMKRVEPALFGRDVQDAIQICRAEETLDSLYINVFRELLAELGHGKDAQSLVTAIFVCHYFERMGDSLLNIGEAIISACLGEPVKMSQFQALESSLKESELGNPVGGVALQAIPGTRSGHRVARVSQRQDADGSRMVIFKEGRARKLKDEHERIKQWDAIVEGLAPRVYSFQERGDTAALLVEYLPGRTFEQVLLQGDHSEVDAALSSIRATLLRVWEKTRRDEPVKPKFLQQLSKRLRDLYAVHPDFKDGGGSIGPVRIPSFDELLECSAALDEQLVAPFSVFIHGDFNVDNVIYDPLADRVHFIDLHRSEQMDYVQDISVFLVSNLRLQALKTPVRRRIDHSVSRFYRFARDFAESSDDRLFGARLALGLARSFATSTRFVLDAQTAKAMILKSRFLLEKLASCDPAALDSFSVPEEVLRG